MNEGEHLSHFAWCKDNGQFLALLRTDEIKDWPLAFEGLLIEKLDPVQVNGERASGNVLDVDEIEKELSDLLFAQLIGRASIVASEDLYGGKVAFLGLLRITSVRLRK
jgi:hypothetical protein